MRPMILLVYYKGMTVAVNIDGKLEMETDVKPMQDKMGRNY